VRRMKRHHGCAREGRIISAVGKFRPAAQRLSISIAPVLISLCLVRLLAEKRVRAIHDFNAVI
jgi:hypothetical protein